MSEEGTPASVADDETLARFVLFSRWVRPGDQTIRPEAFIPPGNLELSVTRHVDLREAEIWEIGQSIAERRPAVLYGRADIRARAVRSQKLNVVPTLVPKNHANITGWPSEKAAQKIIALELAAVAAYVANPNAGDSAESRR